LRLSPPLAACLIAMLVGASLGAVLLQPTAVSDKSAEQVIIWPTQGGGFNRSGQSPFNTSDNQGQVYWRVGFSNRALIEQASPVIGSDDTIYLSDGNSIYALTPQGKTKWTVTNSTIDERTPGWWTLFCPRLSVSNESIIYVSFAKFNDTVLTYWLLAIGPEGKPLWLYPTVSLAQGAPAIASDGTIVFTTSQIRDEEQQFLYALDPNGSLRWRMELSIPFSFASPAMDPHDTIYLTAQGDRLDRGVLQAVRVDGTKSWSVELDATSSCTPVVTDDGRILVGDDAGSLYAFRAADGGLLWKVSPSPGFPITGGMAVAQDGTAYLSTNGTVYSIDPEGAMTWSTVVGPLGRSDSPAIGSDGSIFVGNCSLNPDGSLRWRMPFDACSPAIQFDGTVVCIDITHNALVAIDRAPNAQGVIVVLSTTSALAVLALLVYGSERKRRH